MLRSENLVPPQVLMNWLGRGINLRGSQLPALPPLQPRL
jgi:hypothetical protein